MRQKSVYFETGTIITVKGHSLNRRLRELIREQKELEAPWIRYWFRPCEAWLNAWREYDACYYWDTDSMRMVTK